MQKINIYSQEHFDKIEKGLSDNGEYYKTVSSGNVEKIVILYAEYTMVNKEAIINKGYHLIRMFNKELDSYIKNNPKQLKKLKYYSIEPPIRIINPKGIKKNLADQENVSPSIDIKDCYWRTLYNLKYISKKLYDYGLQKQEWKTGRNSCLGNLNKQQFEKQFFCGKEIIEDRKTIEPNIHKQRIRNHVMSHVYNLFYELKQKIGDDFYMLLTDCVFTNYKQKEYAESFFLKNGYETKSRPIEFIQLDEAAKKIYWKDFTFLNEDNTIGKDTYMYYSANEVIN